MNEHVLLNPAEKAAQEALESIFQCLDQGESFLLEAGAGAGKTYSLIEALKYIISKKGVDLTRMHQKVACITYTNVASDEITERTGRHPVVLSSTIHSFCWSLIKDFQPYLREKIGQYDKWAEKIEEAGGINAQVIEYDLGYRSITDERISLGHNDIIYFTKALLEEKKFRDLFTARYPILFIDEYQDTSTDIAESIKTSFLDTGTGPLIGFFGDHWQKIYGDGCGKIEHPAIKVIGNGANFRSVTTIVDALNKIRPELTQAVRDPKSTGIVGVYHTNDWNGDRLTGAHWKDDLPEEVANESLTTLRKKLISDGWNFEPDKTKILILTHNALATKQGYNNLASVFPNNDQFIKKEDIHIKFFADTLEPVCIAYANRHYGEMFNYIGNRTPSIKTHADKKSWAKNMDSLLKNRSEGNVGEVIDHLRQARRPRLPDAVEKREMELQRIGDQEVEEESGSVTRLRKLREVSYREVVSLCEFIDDKTPFSTKHGVKGIEFENVLVVFGRGWNQYDFNQFLEWAGDENNIPQAKWDKYERNRNLFYVVCSRPIKRLALLFTQELTTSALSTLTNWFGESAVNSLPLGQ